MLSTSGATSGGAVSSQVVGQAGTITLGTPPASVVLVAPTAIRAGIILTVGTVEGQLLYVVNNSNFALTFDVVATSNVQNGTGCVITANTARLFVWEVTVAAWCPVI